MLRWSAKSNSRSTEEDSSISLAEEIEVHAVAELPLLSEELDEWPRQRHNEDSCSPAEPSIKFHFLLMPFEAEMKWFGKVQVLRHKLVSP